MTGSGEHMHDTPTRSSPSKMLLNRTRTPGPRVIYMGMIELTGVPEHQAYTQVELTLSTRAFVGEPPAELFIMIPGHVPTNIKK
jgi:hypothetical protein